MKFINYILKHLTITLGIIQSIPSRVFFGNTISFKNNFLPLIKSLKNKPNNKNSLINREGFLKLTTEKKNLIQIISKKFSEKIENEKYSNLNRGGFQRRLTRPIEIIPEIKELEKIFKNFLDSYYQSEYFIENILAFRNYKHESTSWSREKYIYSNLWHFDNFIADKLKVFILLNNNINRLTGATKVINKNNSKKLVRNFRFSHTSLVNKKLDEYIIKKEIINYFEGNIGDIYIVNAQSCLHAASIPIDANYRDMIQFEILKK